MKTRTNILTIFIAIIMLFTACNDDFENVFSESANQRLNNLFDNCNAVLTEAPNGWEMQYFINSESKGYNLLMDFNTDYSVKIAGDNEINDLGFTESVSSYEMNSSQGPIIAFDTYNDVLHPFADPDINSNIGDFEFVIMSVSDDAIVLKGKKNQHLMLLNKIPDNIGWEDYISEINDFNNTYFHSEAPELTMSIDGQKTNYLFTNGSSSVFTVTDIENDTTFSYPCIFSKSGFRLQDTEDISGSNTQAYYLSSDKSAYVSRENENVKLVGPEVIAPYFVGTTANWVLNTNDMSDNVKVLHNTIVKAVEDKYDGVENIFLAINGIPSENAFSLTLGFLYDRKIVRANLYLDFEGNAQNNIDFTYNGSGNSAGTALGNAIPAYVELANLISTSFSLSTEAAVSIPDLTFTNSNNSIWFTTNRK